MWFFDDVVAVGECIRSLLGLGNTAGKAFEAVLDLFN